MFCPVCHIEVRSTDYFCSNCGKNLHPAPPGTTVADQAKLYLGSIFLAPMGIVWGLRYLRGLDQKSKVMGMVAIGLSTITILVVLKYTVDFINTLNSQMGKGLQGIEGL